MTEFKTRFCFNCGARVFPEQYFCEKCGTKLRELEEDAPSEVQPDLAGGPPVAHVGLGGHARTGLPEETEYQGFSGSPGEMTQTEQTFAEPITARQSRGTGKLFDPDRDFYVLHEKYWDWGSGDILDEQANLIGKMHRKWISLRGLIELKEMSGEVKATIHRKILAVRQTFDLKDKYGEPIARFRRAILAIIHPKVYMENPAGDKVLEARGNFMRWDYEIWDVSDGHKVAEIHKLDKWRDVFLGGIFDFADQYAVHIVDPNVDRRLVLGFALAIDNSMHDSHSHGIGMHNATRFGNHWKGHGRSVGWRGF